MPKKKRRTKQCRPPLAAYQRKLALLMRSGLFPPGTVVLVEVLHDDNCAHFGGGVCGCAAELKLHPQPRDPT